MKRSTGGVCAAVLGAAAAAILVPGASRAQQSAKDIIAAHIRTQGYACEKPISAVRDPELSRPDEPVWLLKCENHSYQVRLVPDMAAKVNQID